MLLAVLATGGALSTVYGGHAYSKAGASGFFVAQVAWWLLTLPFDPLPPDFAFEVFAVTTTTAIGYQMDTPYYWQYVSPWLYLVEYGWFAYISWVLQTL